MKGNIKLGPADSGKEGHNITELSFVRDTNTKSKFIASLIMYNSSMMDSNPSKDGGHYPSRDFFFHQRPCFTVSLTLEVNEKHCAFK